MKLTTEDDLLALIGTSETFDLEFKSCGALGRGDKAKGDISKDVSSMANSAGGTIVYGVVEENHVASSIDTGFDQSEFSKEWLEQVIDSNIHPRLQGLKIDVVPLPSRNDRVAYVVTVQQAMERAPHQASDHRYYKRGNFRAVPMQDYEIRDVLRRAIWPDLHLTWQIHGLQTRFNHDLKYVFHLTAEANNRSSEPAYYSTCTLCLDARLEVVASDVAQVAGRHLPDGTAMNCFSRQFMLPRDFPIIREQTTKVGSLYVGIREPSAAARFVIGSSLRAPGCERDAYSTLILQHGQLELGNYRAQ